MKELNPEAVDILSPALQGCVVCEIHILESYVKLVWVHLSSTHLCFQQHRRKNCGLQVYWVLTLQGLC